MPRAPHFRFVPLALLAALPLAAGAQGSSLPPNPATSLATQQVAPLSATAPVRDEATRAHRAEVVYASGLMTVNAQNSSLNAILREISRQTGMTITGGVREERVFGHYGPASPSDILATLLGGTGTNMVLRQNASTAPVELVLTPRNGGATPPNPNASRFEDEGADDQDHDQPQRPQQPPVGPPQPASYQPGVTVQQPGNNVLGDPHNGTPTASQFPTTNSVSTDSLPTPTTATQPSQGIVDTPNQTVTVPSSTTDSSTTTTTSGQKTPEQIFQELQQLRQQQQKTTTPQ